MASKEDIHAGLSELMVEVKNAREKLLQGELIVIDNVNQRIDGHCLAITELEPDDAIEIKPVLDALLNDMQTFSQEISYVQNKVSEILAKQSAQTDGDSPSQSDSPQQSSLPSEKE
jgi:hypothetical protein